LLLKDAPDQLQLDRAELDTLLERQLVTLERIALVTKRPFQKDPEGAVNLFCKLLTLAI
jgi:hypothetical protein